MLQIRLIDLFYKMSCKFTFVLNNKDGIWYYDEKCNYSITNCLPRNENVVTDKVG